MHLKHIRIKKLPLLFFNYLLLIFFSLFYFGAYSGTKDNLGSNNDIKIDKNKKIKSQYILGPGDILDFKILGIHENFSQISIGPDGYLNFEDIDQIFANGFTINELREKLIANYSEIMFDPEIKIYINSYRPINIYIYGEVKRPGIYTLSGHSSELETKKNKPFEFIDDYEKTITSPIVSQTYLTDSIVNDYKIPSLYDAIRASQGLTPYSDLSNIIVLRKTSTSQGEGKLKTKINFWKLFEEGDTSQNISLQDGDVILIEKSERMLSERLLKVSSYNLSPDNIRVFVSGNVKNPGEIVIPQGSSLVQALARSGGKEILSGDIEFIRFDRYSFMEKRTFRYSADAKVNTYKNPILISGDIINVKRSALGYSTEVISKVTSPVIGIYSLINLFDD